MSDEEATDSEEEILVFAEFEGSVNIENYRSIHVLGIKEKHPIIQLDETIFKGHLESSLGTYMFFEKDQAPQSTDPLFDKLPKENVKYLCKANKYLNMKHTYITPKDHRVPLSQQFQPVEQELVPISFRTVDEAIEKFQEEWKSKIPKTDVTTDPSDHEMTDLTNN